MSTLNAPIERKKKKFLVS